MENEKRIGVYICHCGLNIAGTVDVEEVTKYAATLPHVVVARDYRYICSDPGQELIKNDIKELKLNRVVVASCSPRMHEHTFRKACLAANLNPYLYEHANIREHCSWIHADRKLATEKAKDLIRAAVRRVYYHEPLQTKEIPVNPNTLVVGGGIAGIEAALKIANAGRKVYLVEKEPSIGGHMIQLDTTFPTLDCSECIMTPKMSEVGHHPKIELLAYSEVVEVSGSVGKFKVRIRKKARYVDEEKCTGCGQCVNNCPVRYLPQPTGKETRSAIMPGREWKDKEVEIEIDGRMVRAKEGMTVLEAARSAGIDIPSLCYHKALTPLGICRICVVELIQDEIPRLVTSCTELVKDGLVIKTKSEETIAWRKKVIEFMLINAPQAKAILDLAEKYGVKKPKAEISGINCIFCELCGRICQERIGAKAIVLAERFRRDEKKCLRCGACAFVCPTEAIKPEEFEPKAIPIPSEFEMGMESRPPIYIPFPQAVPNVPVIDRERCVHFITGGCNICGEFCDVKAINFGQVDQIIELEVGTIILATGYDVFDASKIPQYGYGRYDNVITALQFERMTCAAGPTSGNIQLKDGRTPQSVAIIHCVGSRDKNYREYCSKICCMYALKHAHHLREKINADVYQMYIDMRCTGDAYEEFYKRVSEEGVVFVKGKVAEVTDRANTEEEKGKLIVVTEDTLLGKLMRIPVDMVILCPAIIPRSDATEVARKFSITQKATGFFLERHAKLEPQVSAMDGIFLAGCCQFPKDIPDSVSHGRAAAAAALELIDRGSVVTEAAIARVDESFCHGCGICEEICEFQAPRVIVKDGRKVSTLNEALCKGCGVCAVACPSGAMSIRHFTRDEISSMIKELAAVEK